MKRFGIHLTLPKGDPLALPHLLGPNWEAFRWYDTPAERDRALEELGREHLFSRRGDVPSLHANKIDRET